VSIPIAEAARRLTTGEVSSADLVATSLAAIDDVDGDLSSFVHVDFDGASEAAVAADKRLAAGETGPMLGVPVAVKDIIHMPGLPTLCGSPAYSTNPVEEEATVVTKLREAGAVVVGKTTAHELACGVYSDPAANPWATDRLPGGSSGGSGAAVAAGIVAMALGSDTGGSIRIPAAVCGVAGLKPTYGRVSRAGIEPLAWSLDHIGPLAATVADCATTLNVLAGRDSRDPTTSDEPVPDFTAHLDDGVDGLRLGILDGPPFSPMQPAVAAGFNDACSLLAALGAQLVPVEIPELEYSIAAEFGIVGPEAALYHRKLLRNTPELIDPGIRALLVGGTLLPGAHYLKALEARRVLSAAIHNAFTENNLDAVLTPTLPATAALREQEEFEYEGLIEPVTISYVRTTAPFNLSGIPALSIPCGYDESGLPVGLQIAGKPYDEQTVLRIGAAYEASTAWHHDLPPIHAPAEVT